MEFIRANKTDIDAIMKLINQAKAYLKSMGVNQWQTGYPDTQTITADVENKNGYLLKDDGNPIGYICISFDGEESYNTIQGKWKSEQPYGVLHRMAIDNTYKGKGLASKMLQYSEALCRQKGIHSIKIDTDEDNAAMRHILEKNGYDYCGVIRFDNSDKIAFEKLF